MKNKVTFKIKNKKQTYSYKIKTKLTNKQINRIIMILNEGKNP